jgi:hypothetical protein
MFDINPHFLDSNILLGKILHRADDNSILPKENVNKNYSICQLYFEHECKRYISKRVENESKNVFNRLRRISLKLLDFVQSYAKSNNINPLKIDSVIHFLKKNFLNKYKDFPEGVKKEKFNNIIEGLFNTYDNVFREELLSYNNKIEDYKKNTTDAFKIYSKDLNNLITILINGEFYHEGESTQYEEDIGNFGIHHADKLILLDCYYLAKYNLNTVVAFITQDSNIISNESNIQSVFDINFPIFNPNKHIST